MTPKIMGSVILLLLLPTAWDDRAWSSLTEF